MVHGRNEEIRKGMFTFLRSIGLHPLEWPKIVKATGKPNPYIGEVLEKGFAMAQAVLVLMTPDDEVRLREELRRQYDSADEQNLTFQPRPNVLIEAGMALGMYPDRTIIVEIGPPLRQITDLLGRHVIKLNNSAPRRHELVQRLQTAGCEVDTTGQDWYTEGNFELNPLNSDHEEETSQDLNTKQSTESVIKNNNYTGLTGGIQFLIDDGFFNNLQSVKATQIKLKTENYHYEAATITQILTKTFANKRKVLKRIKDGGIWKFVIRK